MGTLEFIAALVEDLVWPLTVVLGIFVFRGPISNLLPFLQRLRYKDFVVEFNQKLDEVETQVAAITGEGADVRVEDDMLELAQAHPRGAVIDSWLAIEKAIRDVAASRKMEVDLPRQRSTLAIERELARSRVLSPAVVSLLRDLRSTRNEVAHRLDVPLTPEMARQYASAALRVVVTLEELSATPPGAVDRLQE